MSKRLLVLLLTLAMAAAACASGSDAEDASTTTNVGSSADNDADDSSGDDATQSEPSNDSDADDDQDNDGGDTTSAPPADSDEPSMAADSPIGAFFADDGGFDTAVEEYSRRVEEEIVRCMAAEGFEFKVGSTASNENPVADAQSELSRRAWTELYGYGISTSFESVATGQSQDPNAEIFFSMSPSERDVWVFTLTGSESLGGGPVDDSRPLEEQGCIGQSIIATGGGDALEGLGDFGDAYEEAEELLFDRNEMIIAVGDWSQCMGDAGYAGFSDLDDPQNDIGDRLSEITAPIGEALAELEADEGQALFDGNIDAIPGLDVDALRALQAEEIETAQVDLDCYEAHVQAIYEPLRDELERGLMTEYSSELDALKNIGG